MDNQPTNPSDITTSSGFPKQFYSDQEVVAPQFNYPNQMNSGVARGAQRISNTDGSYIIIGAIPGTNGQFGIAFFDAQNRMISKTLGSTDYKYDLATGKNYYQNGKLPDGTYGAIFAKSGVDVSSLFI